MSVGGKISNHQDTNSVVDIKNYIESINRKELEDTSFSIDGRYKEDDAITVGRIGSSELTAYSDGNSLVKLKVFYNGSHGNLTTTIFCKNGKAVFIRKILEIYDPPKHEKGSQVKMVMKNEFYFSNDRIISFENDGGVIRYNQPEELNLEMKFEELNQDYNNYIKLFK
jgi:hypothetical protein